MRIEEHDVLSHGSIFYQPRAGQIYIVNSARKSLIASLLEYPVKCQQYPIF